MRRHQEYRTGNERPGSCYESVVSIATAIALLSIDATSTTLPVLVYRFATKCVERYKNVEERERSLRLTNDVSRKVMGVCYYFTPLFCFLPFLTGSECSRWSFSVPNNKVRH
jgi:hypothetical protein